MKIWTIIISVILIIAVGVLFISQRGVEAQTQTQVMFMHCERVGADFKVISADGSISTDKPSVNSSCANALSSLLASGYKIQSNNSDVSGTFNFLLLK